MKLALALILTALTGPAAALDRPVPAQPLGKVVIGKGSTGPASDLCAALPGSNLCRPLGERMGDVLNAKDYGARLDASQDDAPAYRAAKAAATVPGQRITLPAGTRYTFTDITGPRPVWWDIAGPLSFQGGAPSPAIGDDLTSSTINGRTRLWWRENPVPRVDPVFRIERTDTSTEGGPDIIQGAAITNCNLRGKAKSVYCNVTSLKVHSGQSVPDGLFRSGHYGLLSVAERMPDSPLGAPPVAALYTELNDGTNLPDSATGGNSGMNMAEMDFYTNGTDLSNYRTLFALRIGSYSNTFTATTTSGSTAIAGIDLRFALQPQNDISGSCLPSGTKVASYTFSDGGSTAILTRPATTTGTCSLTVPVTPGEVGQGFDLSPASGGPGGRVGIGYAVNMPFYGAGFDAANGRSDNNAPAFRMGEGQRLAFDGAGRGYQSTFTRSLRYLQGNLLYGTQAGDVLKVTDSGKVTAAGGFQTPDLPAPASPSDPMGELGDVRFNGPYMFRKTTSGWLRFTGTASWP